MSQARQPAVIETESFCRIGQLKRQSAPIGRFLVCTPTGSDDRGCGRKCFVAYGQNPPSSWMYRYSYDDMIMYRCDDCACKHLRTLRAKGFRRLRGQNRRASLHRKRQAKRDEQSRKLYLEKNGIVSA